MDTLPSQPWGFAFLDVSNPIVAWMVYRGILQSSDQASAPDLLSFFISKTISRSPGALIVEREGRFEGARQLHAPEKLSRLTSLFAYPDIDAAERGATLGYFRMQNLSEISPATEIFRREIYDSDLVDQYGSVQSDEVARRYWVEEPTSPHREMLLTGSFHVLNNDLRARAKETIWELGEGSRVALELARLAAFFGSEFGAVYPALEKVTDGTLKLSYQVRWDDRIGADILGRAYAKWAGDRSFYIDWEAIEPIQVSPDKRDAKYFTLPDFRGKLNKTVAQETLSVLQQASYGYVARHKA